MKAWIFGKFGLITFLISTFCLYFLAFYFDFNIRNIPMFKTIISGNDYEKTIENATKTILFWNTMFNNPNFYFGKGDIFHDCPVNDCFVTHDRNYMDSSKFDAILFHGNELELEDLPEDRQPEQRYVYVNLESPENRPLVDEFYEDYFNLTMTYRLDSDVPYTYGNVVDLETNRIVAPLRNTSWANIFNNNGFRESKEPGFSDIKRKKKAVSWFVSSCHAKSGRSEYVKELSKYIEVDVYGKCGDYSCPRGRDCLGEVVEPNYFFYLSLENSLCQDYVTEKLYNPLRYNVVPIVYGGANYTLFAPPHSYVNILDFDSPKDLARYLKKLMENPREYKKYFQWKTRYKIEPGARRTACKLCEFLHERNDTRIYDPISDWYSRGKCPLQRILRTLNQHYATRSTLKNRD